MNEIKKKKFNYKKRNYAKNQTNNSFCNNSDNFKNDNENQSDYDTTNEENEKNNKNNKNKNNINSIREPKQNEKCRMCFSSASTKDNPKLRICSCKDYIHFECLKKYLKNQIEIQENSDFTVQSYICPKFNCEICSDPYPLRFRIKEYNKIYELIDYNIAPELDCLVLESLDHIIDGFNYKMVHVIQLINEKIFIGRYFFNDIIDTDISVSRSHAVLKYDKEKGYITIENKSETFGTLVLIKGNIKIKEKKIGFQVGRSYITACMIEKNISENEF
jgi:hypothetical protein